MKETKSNRASYPDKWQGSNQTGKERPMLAALRSVKAEYRKQTELVEHFLRKLKEVSPIVDAAKHQGKTEKEVKTLITSLFALHKTLIDLVSSHVQSTPPEAISSISASIGELIRCGLITELGNKKEILWVLDLMSATTKEESSRLGDFYKKNSGEHTESHIKVLIFPESLLFGEALKTLPIPEDERAKILKTQAVMSINLARELAITWAADTNFREKERIFFDVLPGCAKIARETWVSLFTNDCDDVAIHDIPYVNELLSQFKPNFDSENFYAEAGHTEREIKDLLAVALLNKTATQLTNGGNRREVTKFRTQVLKFYCGKAGEAWKKVKQPQPDNNKTEHHWFDSPTTDAITRPLLEEVNRCANQPPYITEIVSEDDWNRESKNNLALLWGLSDAICKARVK